MPDARLGLALWVLLTAPVLAQPLGLDQSEERVDPALEARIRTATALTTDTLTEVDLPEGLAECTPRSVDVLTDRIFRFSEEGDETGCAHVYIPVFVPRGAETMRVTFQANRIKVPTLEQQPTQQQFIQEVRLLDGDNVLLDEEVIFDETAGQQDTQEFEFLFRFPAGTRDARISWYFEDGQNFGDLVPGVSTTPAWRSEVRSPAVAFDPQPVAFDTHHLADVVLEEEEVILHGAVVDVTLETTDLLGGTHELELDVLGAYSLQALTLPGGADADRDDLRFTTSGGTTTMTVPDAMIENPGTYSFLLQSTSPYTVVDAPPATIYPLAWAGIFLPLGFAVAASVHHEVFRRHRVSGQGAAWVRMTTYLVILWLAYAALVAAWFVLDGRAEMGTLPVSTRGVSFWAAIAFAVVLFAVHWGVGAMRRRQARRLRHERELEARNVMLERSNRELEQFAFMAAHDLQEPLRKVISYTTLLQHRYKDKLDKKADQYIDQAAHQADRMRDLITDVLAFSRIDGNVEMAHVDLDEVYKELQRDMPDDLRETGVTLGGKDLGKVWGNPPMVRQLLENLIGNGVKYRRPGVKPRIQVATEDQGRHVLVSVKDNGIGIEPEYQERVFEVFERLHGADSAYKGTGIGLAICKKIVEAHGGRIWVESTPGKGSTFFFTLPHGGS